MFQVVVSGLQLAGGVIFAISLNIGDPRVINKDRLITSTCHT
jgi:hypothetical protein